MRIGIVGTGLAGLRVAAQLHDSGYEGEIIAWNAEATTPYDRPPLSKELLGTYFRPLSEQGLGDLEKLATVIPHAAQSVESCARGWNIDGYEVTHAVIASGSRPVCTIEGALTLYSLHDAELLAALARPGSRVDIVGAGWIGTELASVLAAQCDVHLWEASEHILGRNFAGAVTDIWKQWLGQAGVHLHLLQPFSSDSIKGDPSSSLVIQASGSRPTLDFLTQNIQRNSRGALITDKWNRVTHEGRVIPGLYAVGDCADGVVCGGHWSKALHDAEWVASSIIESQEPRFRAPAEIFSTQFGHDIGFVGKAEGELIRQDSDKGLIMRWEKNGEMTGLLAVDSPRELAKARKELRRR